MKLKATDEESENYYPMIVFSYISEWLNAKNCVVKFGQEFFFTNRLNANYFVSETF